MRVVRQPAYGMTDTDPLQAVKDLTSRGLFAHAAMQRQHFIQLLFQRMQGIERHHRLLKNHRDPITAHLTQRALIGVKQRLAVKANVSAGVADRRRGEQPQHRERGDAFTGAGFPHQRQGFPGANIQGELADDGMRFPLLAEGDGEVVYL
ncbi:Uncharacterised protein [Raoultella planticola]|nr:Uncharacterised protein [Raoultella planticola]